MRTVPIVCIAAALLLATACRGARLAPVTAAEPAAHTARAEASRGTNVFDRFLGEREGAPGVLEIDVDDVARRVREEQERRALGRRARCGWCVRTSWCR